MHIRAARPDDAETLFAIQKEAALAAYAHIFPPDLYPFPDDQVRSQWRERLGNPDATTLVAERDGKAVGYVAFGDGQVDSLYVLPEAQGSGVGSGLLANAVEAHRRLGVACCRLWVAADNHAARRFYERRGWCADGRARRTSFPPHPLMLGYTRKLDREGSSGLPDSHVGTSARMEDPQPTGRDADPAEASGGLGDEPGREQGSDTPALTRGTALPDAQRAGGGHAAFDPELAEGAALPHTDALDPSTAGVPLAPEGSGAAREVGPFADHEGESAGGGVDAEQRTDRRTRRGDTATSP